MAAVPFTFTAHVTARSAEINTNFATIYALALDKTGDTMTGTLGSRHIIPSSNTTYDLGSASFHFRKIYVDAIEGVTTASAFGTIAVSGQSNIVAETTNDTLTVVAGAGITLTTDAATDTLTVTATGTVGGKAGTSSINFGGYGKIYNYANATGVGNVGTGVDTLYTQSIAANVLATDGDSIIVHFGGLFANNTNDKRIVVKFGSTTALDMLTGQAPLNRAFSGKVVITRIGASSQMCIGELTVDTYTGSFAGKAAAAETLSSAVTLLVTGEATSNNDIVLNYLDVFWAGDGPST